MRIGDYYPRKLKKGWCVAYEYCAGGVTIERFGARYPIYIEAYEACMRLNAEDQR